MQEGRTQTTPNLGRQGLKARGGGVRRKGSVHGRSYAPWGSSSSPPPTHHHHTHTNMCWWWCWWWSSHTCSRLRQASSQQPASGISTQRNWWSGRKRGLWVRGRWPGRGQQGQGQGSLPQSGGRGPQGQGQGTAVAEVQGTWEGGGARGGFRTCDGCRANARQGVCCRVASAPGRRACLLGQGFRVPVAGRGFSLSDLLYAQVGTDVHGAHRQVVLLQRCCR